MVLISSMKNILSGSNLPVELNFTVKLKAQNRVQIKVLCLCSLFSILYSVLVGITLHCLREWRWVTNNPFLPLSPKNQLIKPQKKQMNKSCSRLMDCIDFTEFLFAVLVSPVFLLLVSHYSSRGDVPVLEIKDRNLDLISLEVFSNFSDSNNGQSNPFHIYSVCSQSLACAVVRPRQSNFRVLCLLY